MAIHKVAGIAPMPQAVTNQSKPPVRSKFVAVPLIVIALFSCNGEKRRLTAEIETMEHRRASLQRRLDERRSDLRESEDQLHALQRELTAHNTEIPEFIVQHRLAATCLRAAQITLGDHNEYSQQLARAAGWGTVLCTVALLDQRFAREVTMVANRVNTADARARDLKEQIQRAQQAVDGQQARVRDDEAALDQVSADIGDLEYRLLQQ